MELSDYLSILRAHWVGVRGSACLSESLAAGRYNQTQPEVYEASATGFVTTGKTRTRLTPHRSTTLAKSRVTSYVASRPARDSPRP